jgi:hypothetical protein
MELEQAKPAVLLPSSVFFQKNSLWTCNFASHPEARAIDLGCLRMRLTEDKSENLRYRTHF